MDDITIVEMDDFKKQRVGVLCLPGLDSFLPAIVAELGKTYAVRTCYSQSMAEIEKVVGWADILFLEFCNQLVIEMTQKMPILAEKQVIVRLHSYEALSNFAPQVNWAVVDSLIFVAEHIRDIVLKSIPNLAEMTSIHVIPNGV